MLAYKSKFRAPHIVLANENPDECKLFQDALARLHIHCNISVIENESGFLNLLKERDFLPDFIFWNLKASTPLDRNRVNVIKKNKKLRSTPFILFSEYANRYNKDYCYESESNEYFLRALTFLL